MNSARHNVVHVIPALFSGDDGIVGGAERYVLELARHMADIVPTRLITFGARNRDEQIAGLRIRVIGDPWFVRGQRSNPFALRLLDELRDADVVHCHQQHIVASSVLAFAARLTGRRVYCTDLGGGGWDLSSYVSTDRLYHGHLHISEYSRRIAGHDGKPWALVISGGVDTVMFSPDADVLRGDGVLFVGRLLPHKGVDTLIRALPPDVPARIIGRVFDARYFRDLQEMAAGKQVTFSHDCDDAELVDAYRRAACVVLPSVYDDMYGRHSDVPELLGQTLLEAMACGAPAVCTSVASLPEVVEDGVSGFVVPPNDPDALWAAVRRLLTNRERALGMGEVGRAIVVDRFSWPAVVRRCLQVYQGLSAVDGPRACAA
jgi:glycosyltransferase involved in cell wall biosynthesis